MSDQPQDWAVEPCSGEQPEEWNVFVEESANGTLFHRLDFLAYHPLARFAWHHLRFLYRGKLAAVLPAVVQQNASGERVLTSPGGASIGGFVIRADLRARHILGLVETLVDYLINKGFNSASLRVGPAQYMRQPHDYLGFAYYACGFRMANRWLLPMTPCALSGAAPVFQRIDSAKQRGSRSAEKQGCEVREGSLPDLDTFYDMLMETHERLSATPTHTREELRRLFELVPGRIRFFMVYHQNMVLAGTMVFMLNKQAATTFYICRANQSAGISMHAASLLYTKLQMAMEAEGIVYLDYGPCSDEHGRVNDGNAFFKENLGALGFCRDLWVWRAPDL